MFNDSRSSSEVHLLEVWVVEEVVTDDQVSLAIQVNEVCTSFVPKTMGDFMANEWSCWLCWSCLDAHEALLM